eukprot:bmy_02554T0
MTGAYQLLKSPHQFEGKGDKISHKNADSYKLKMERKAYQLEINPTDLVPIKAKSHTQVLIINHQSLPVVQDHGFFLRKRSTIQTCGFCDEGISVGEGGSLPPPESFGPLRFQRSGGFPLRLRSRHADAEKLDSPSVSRAAYKRPMKVTVNRLKEEPGARDIYDFKTVFLKTFIKFDVSISDSRRRRHIDHQLETVVDEVLH